MYNIVNENGTAGAPQIVVDNNENLHVVWHDDRDGDFDIWYAKSSDQGMSWKDNICLNEFYLPLFSSFKHCSTYFAIFTIFFNCFYFITKRAVYLPDYFRFNSFSD